MEVALKIAFQLWQNKGETRTQIVAFDGAYHGDTFGAMALGDELERRRNKVYLITDERCKKYLGNYQANVIEV